MAEEEAREDLKQQHEALFARLVELHAMRMAELFADDTYYVHVNGHEEGPYDRESLQVRVLLFTVTFYANHAHNSTRSP